MATKSKRKSKEIQVSSPSLTDLPMAILVEIVLKLPTKSIVFCKCVCKAWHSLIADPQFVKLHLFKSKTVFLIRDYQIRRIARALYLLNPEDGYDYDGYCNCNMRTCDRCSREIKVTSKLMIPIRNAQGMLRRLGDDDSSNVIFGPKGNLKRKNLIRFRSRNDHIYWNVSSCNGLLCLSDRSGDDPIAVCNPIMGEFIHLPELSNRGKFVLGFGFSPKSDQYKVVRTYVKWIANPASRGYWLTEGVAEVHTLGTDSWRKVNASVFKQRFVDPPIFFEGTLHWFCFGNTPNSCSIISFSLDEELFHPHSVPSQICSRGTSQYRVMGVLGGCLCIYEDSPYRGLNIWAMKEYGVYDSWNKLLSVHTTALWERDYCIFQPLSYLKGGGLLLFRSDYGRLIYCDNLGGQRCKNLRFKGYISKFEIIAYTPSFVSLKDVAKANDGEVLNVYTRCGKIKLIEESNEPLVLEPSYL